MPGWCGLQDAAVESQAAVQGGMWGATPEEGSISSAWAALAVLVADVEAVDAMWCASRLKHK